MMARCIHDTGSELSLPARAHFYSERTKFSVTPGKAYRIAGLGMLDTALLALVCDDTGKPNWLPAGVFDMTNVKVPVSWYLALRNGQLSAGGEPSGQWIAMMGYEELVRDPSHSDALIERDPWALQVFYSHSDEDD
jgi:hypothetical protein